MRVSKHRVWLYFYFVLYINTSGGRGISHIVFRIVSFKFLVMLYSVFLFCFCSYIYFLLSFPERTTFVEILEKESLLSYTAISRKVVGKNVHATIPKGNVGYDQYTVPDTVAVEPTFVKFIQHLQTYVHDLSYHSFKFLWKTVNSRPPTIHFAVGQYETRTADYGLRTADWV